MGDQKTLKFNVVETCDDIHGTAAVVEASEAESAKLLAGECGKVSLYVGDDKSFSVKMYMKITPPTNSAALTAEKPPVTEPADKAIAVTTEKPPVTEPADKAIAVSQAG